ncbi:hypothetical protein NDU88_011295 [Pleurodeles waltl]|uniref:Uncharacterized protein n=1 Tax=Pleurodeles waltl TaxID=8319 RepID=A0AAV7R2N9_PLEWA|nr:hypothetical protein NDU88_011295 [Pleurodeles waltl]
MRSQTYNAIHFKGTSEKTRPLNRAEGRAPLCARACKRLRLWSMSYWCELQASVTGARPSSRAPPSAAKPTRARCSEQIRPNNQPLRARRPASIRNFNLPLHARVSVLRAEITKIAPSGREAIDGGKKTQNSLCDLELYFVCRRIKCSILLYVG